MRIGGGVTRDGGDGDRTLAMDGKRRVGQNAWFLQKFKVYASRLIADSVNSPSWLSHVGGEKEKVYIASLQSMAT